MKKRKYRAAFLRCCKLSIYMYLLLINLFTKICKIGFVTAENALSKVWVTGITVYRQRYTGTSTARNGVSQAKCSMQLKKGFGRRVDQIILQSWRPDEKLARSEKIASGCVPLSFSDLIRSRQNTGVKKFTTGVNTNATNEHCMPATEEM